MTHPPTPGFPAGGPAPDIRLVVTDLDGTLLGPDGEVPAGIWPVLAELDRRGILFCPASGRQYENIVRRFGDAGRRMTVVAENGTLVVAAGEELSSDPLSGEAASAVVRAVRDLAAGGVRGGAVLSGRRSAYVETTDPGFLAQVATHYSLYEVVEDLAAVDDVALKIAVYDFESAERTTAPALERFSDDLQVVVSGQHWVDVMAPTANKGAAVRRLQRAHGITPAQTMVFGDYLNDVQMMEAADYSFAVANAHPDLVASARYVAPPAAQNGVVRTIRRVLGLDLPPQAAIA
jgi:Cof subfamily protein (haloacid dehalogenase superfamily)